MATTGASLNPIYERLNSAPQHHPMNADTFTDWSVEAGDTVTITRDGQTYNTPIHSSSMTWKGGAPMVNVNSTGNEKREAVAKVSKRKYSGSGGGSMRNDQGLYSDVWSEDGIVHSTINQTASSIRSEVSLSVLGLHSEIEQTASSIRSEVAATELGLQSEIEQTATAIRLEVSNATTELSGRITVEAGRITQEVTARQEADSALSGRITIEAGRITQEVTARQEADSTLSGRITVEAEKISLVVDQNGHVKAGVIVDAINGDSSVTIQANRINLDGYVTTSMLSSAFASIDQTTIRILTNSQNAYFNGGFHYNGSSFYFGTDKITMKNLEVGTSITVNSSGGVVTGVNLNKTTIHYLGKA